MMPDLSPDLARRLIAEAREDDARMTRAPWDWRFCDVVQLTDAGKGYPFDLYPDSQTVVTGKCEGCGDARGVVGESDALAIARTRNNLADLASQLEAALAECERLGSYGAMMAEKRRRKDIGEQLDTVIADRDRLAAELQAAHTEIAQLKKTLDDASYEDGDHLPKECRRMIEMLHGEVCAHRERCPKMRVELQAAKEEIERLRARPNWKGLRAENERMRRLVGEACGIAERNLPQDVRYPSMGKSERDLLAAIRREAGDGEG